MVAKTALLTAADNIDHALQEFVCKRGEAKVLVVKVTQLGHLHAVVASHGFEGIPNDDLQRQIWEYLHKNVPPESLSFLYRIDAMTSSEYDARCSRSMFDGGSTEVLRLDTDVEEQLDG